MLLSSGQVDAFRAGADPAQEDHKRGVRGAFLAYASLELGSGQSNAWQIVADVEQSQPQAVERRLELREPNALAESIAASVERGSDELARIMAAADGFQATAEETVSSHHYANVLFNNLRGGIFDDQYRVSARDIRQYVRHFNRDVYLHNEAFLDALPDHLDFNALREAVRKNGDTQLARLCYEYLPVTFGRPPRRSQQAVEPVLNQALG